MDIRKLPEPLEGGRVETGAVQFGDDWPGTFIRGDNAFAWAGSLEALLNGQNDPITLAVLKGLLTTLQASKI